MKLNLLELKIKLVKECETYAKHLLLDLIRLTRNEHSSLLNNVVGIRSNEVMLSLPDYYINEFAKSYPSDRGTVSKRLYLAERKLILICRLINKIPEHTNDTKDFNEFAHFFHNEARQQLEQIRRNDTKVDQYLVPFLKAITGILFCLTIILAPVAYYGLYKTTGSNTGDKLTNLLHEIYDEPKDKQGIQPR